MVFTLQRISVSVALRGNHPGRPRFLSPQLNSASTDPAIRQAGYSQEYYHTMSFSKLGLSTELLRAVSEEGYTTPTPVQAQAIPVILDGRDILAGAQTGTGKTAGFTLPMLQRLQTRKATAGKQRPIRALILTPTRELAAQVAESVTTYGKYLPLKSTVIFGGVNINPQIAQLRSGVDILTATPGRLLDHISQKTIDLSRLEILVLDEADRMLDMGFIRDIRKILALLPPNSREGHEGRQNLLFSATFSDEIRQLAKGLLNDPTHIDVARRNTTVETVAQVVHPVDRVRKREMLSGLINSQNWRQVLVFTRTKHGANKLAEQLNTDGIVSAAIHGNKSQGARTKALADFKDGSVRVLVATDIAARGLDIDQLPHVVNFELPNVPEDYVHRIGRTGRAGNEGEAVSLVCVDEHIFLRDIERLIKREIPKVELDGFTPDPNIAPEPVFKQRQQRPPRTQGAAKSGQRRNNAGTTSSAAANHERRKTPHVAKQQSAAAPKSVQAGNRSAQRPTQRRTGTAR
jgi:ATP-dependent RNA helicase RhlE